MLIGLGFRKTSSLFSMGIHIVEESEIEIKAKELNKELAGNQKIDQNRLREAVKEDLLQGKLLEWLEENNTVIETVSEAKNVAEQSKSKPESKKSKSKSNKDKDISPKN